MVNRQHLISTCLLLFAISFTFFAIQSGDALMYLTFVRDYFSTGSWPVTDPYLYSLKEAPLHTFHEYLSYFIFYGNVIVLLINKLPVLICILLMYE